MTANSVLVSFALCIGQAVALKSRDVEAQPLERLNLPKCTEADTSGKDIDVLLYGVTGFTGKQAALYVADNVAFEHRDFRWAIAGRDRVKLKSLTALVANYVAKPPEQLVFALENEAEVLKMVKRARTVVNFAGPFEMNHGEVVIRAALRGCTHYVDVAEELHWKAKMLHRYGEQAKKRGVVVVQSAAFRSMASEMLAISAAMDAQKAQQAPPTEVMVVWTTLNGAPSGGQRHTANYTGTYYSKAHNPYVLAPEITENMKVDGTMDGMKEYTLKNGKLELSVDPKAALDCAHVRRAMLTGFPGSKISVRQALVGPHVETKRRNFLDAPIDFTAHPERRVKKAPAPGEGPPFWVMRRGSFEGYAVATGKQNATKRAGAGKEIRVTLKGHGDPFIMGTARMATEVGIGLALAGTGGRFGFLTPTGALGMELLERRFEQLDQGTWLRIYHEERQ